MQAVAVAAFDARHIRKTKPGPFQTARQKIGMKRAIDQRYAFSRKVGGGADRAVAPHEDRAICGSRGRGSDIGCGEPARIRLDGRRRARTAEMDVALFQKRRRIAPFAIRHEFRIEFFKGAGPEPGEPQMQIVGMDPDFHVDTSFRNQSTFL
ncbi:hypothetical protein D3C78_1277490 [compost metagenome]